MKPDFEYNFRSILQAPARALKAKKIFAASVYILIAVIIYSAFVYLSRSLDGQQVTGSLNSSGFIPLDIFYFNSIPAQIVYLFGILLAIFTVMTGFMSVAACDIERLRGNPFFSAGDAFRFSLKRTLQLFLSFLAIVVFILLLLLLGIVIGLVARIPYIGELLYSVFFFFPNFIIALFTTVIIFVFCFSILVMPVAVVADRNGESFNSILETFLTLTRHPFRWAGYTSYSLIAAKVCGFLMAYASFRAIQLLQYSSKIGGGEKIDSIIASGAARLPLDSELVGFTTCLFPFINFNFNISSLAAGATGHWSGYIMMFMLLAVFIMIWGYKLSIVATTQAYSYVIIKYIRDGHKISEEKSLFYEEEWINPPIAKDDSTEDTEDT